ncbi:site-2 protease family protein [Patescibacteria group bacterium]|nr:site-2 protease family protein [Patescibacteria group bacterium]
MNNELNRQSLTIGTFFGIKLRVHYSWLIIFALIAWTVISGVLPAYYPKLSLGVRVVDGLIITLLFFIAAIAHEYAHSLVARRYGLIVKRITLFLFGGASELQNEPTDAKTEFLMTAAGPGTSLLIAALFWGIWAIAKSQHVTVIEIIAGIDAILNLIIGLFNLVPAYPLDGGRLFRSLVWLKTKDVISATKAASYLSYVLSYAMAAFGILEVIDGNLVGGIWFLILGLYLHQLTRASYQQTLNQVLLSKVKVKDVMETDFATVPADTPLENYFNDYVLRYREYFFLITKGERVIGELEAAKVMRKKNAFYDQSVEKFMQPLSEKQFLKPSDPAAKALQLMRQYDEHILPVVEGKKLTAQVTTQHINDYLIFYNQHRVLNNSSSRR